MKTKMASWATCGLVVLGWSATVSANGTSCQRCLASQNLIMPTDACAANLYDLECLHYWVEVETHCQGYCEPPVEVNFESRARLRLLDLSETERHCREAEKTNATVLPPALRRGMMILADPKSCLEWVETSRTKLYADMLKYIHEYHHTAMFLKNQTCVWRGEFERNLHVVIDDAEEPDVLMAKQIEELSTLFDDYVFAAETFVDVCQTALDVTLPQALYEATPCREALMDYHIAYDEQRQFRNVTNQCHWIHRLAKHTQRMASWLLVKAKEESQKASAKASKLWKSFTHWCENRFYNEGDDASFAKDSPSVSK